MRAVLNGDREAFRLLVERESGMVIRACYRVLGDLHEAEDAAQEAFVTAFRSLGTWRGDGPFAAWIARIAVRIALRHAARRRPVLRIDSFDALAAEVRSTTVGRGDSKAGLIGSVLDASDGQDPEVAAVVGERDAELRAAVASLEEPYREVVAMRFFGERSLAEIAEVSGRPVATVKTHLHRGLRQLRIAMEAAEGGR